MKKDFIFKCKKCGHNVYCSEKKLKTMPEYDCPECGEEGYENWILTGTGHFKDFNN